MPLTKVEFCKQFHEAYDAKYNDFAKFARSLPYIEAVVWITDAYGYASIAETAYKNDHCEWGDKPNELMLHVDFNYKASLTDEQLHRLYSYITDILADECSSYESTEDEDECFSIEMEFEEADYCRLTSNKPNGDFFAGWKEMALKVNIFIDKMLNK